MPPAQATIAGSDMPLGIVATAAVEMKYKYSQQTLLRIRKEGLDTSGECCIQREGRRIGIYSYGIKCEFRRGGAKIMSERI